MRHIFAIAAAVAALVAVSQSAFAQYYPSVPASPGPGKPMAYFQQDDAVCQQWANQQVAYQQQAANNDVGAGVVGGAVGGAIIGGLLGGGKGAAIGAGAGALTGGVAGSANAADAQAYGQQRFDSLYQQCMVGRGNSIGYAPPPSAPPPPNYNRNYDNGGDQGGPSDE